MASPSAPRWQSHRGDEWWWSAAPDVVGSFNPATGTFSIDEPPEDSAPRLWALLSAAGEQFPGSTIECRRPTRVASLLDQLQAEGKLTWTDADHPHSRYARIDLVPTRARPSVRRNSESF